MDVSVNKKENAEVELNVEVPAEQFAEYRDKAIQEAGKDVEVDGFRKGNVPQDVLEKQLGEETILGHMAEIAINDLYPQILRENQIDAIGQPNVSITKIGQGGPLGFTVTVATMPEVSIGDYASAAKEIYANAEDITVEEKEVEDTIEEVRKRHASASPQQDSQEEGGESQEGSQEGSEEHSHELPELTDEFVQGLGDFSGVEDFKEKIREGIKMEKEKKQEDSKRMEVIEKIIEQSDIEVPEVLVSGELDRMMTQFEGQVSQAGGSLDDYLSQTGKSRDDMRNDWREDAVKRVKAQLILNKIATEQELVPSKEEVDQQLEQMQEQYPDADPNRLRGYIEMMLTNEKVFEYLKGQAGQNQEN